MQDSNAAWVVAAGVILTAMGLVGNFYAVPSLVQSMVMEKVALKEGSEALERFRKTPQPLHFHVYLFHVENPEEVSGQGARPVLTEKGPYIYDMYRERVELEFHDQDDTVSYLPKSSYYFNKDKSGCRSESDTVTVIHAPILGTALKLQQVSAMGLGIFNDAVPLLFTAKNIFLTTTVGELLFSGVFINCSFPEDSFPAGAVCQGLRQRAPATYRRDGLNFYFSMFGHLNGTSHERIRVHRGQDDARAVGVITAVAGNATLATWRQGTPCNLINGTDGTLFGPFQRGATVLPIYTSASCRSLYLHYKEDTDLNGVPVMRFAIDTDMLASGLEYAPNRCFCVIAPEEDQQADPDEEEAARRRRRAAGMTVEEKEAKSCLPNGTMSLAPCSGSPVILSFPHFYLGDKALVDYPVGLAPREEAHQTIVDIEPTTGIPLRAKKRVQLNMFLKKIEDFNYLASVSEGLFPILWMEEGITLQGASFDKVASANRSLGVLAALPWAVLGVGALLALAGLALLSGLVAALRPKSPRVRHNAKRDARDARDASAEAAGYYRHSMGFSAEDAAFAGKALGRHSDAAPPYRGMLGDDAGYLHGHGSLGVAERRAAKAIA